MVHWWSLEFFRRKSGPEQTALGNSSLQLPEWLEPFTEGMSEGASSSSTDAVPAEPPPAIPPPTSRLEKPSSNKPGGKHNLFKHSPKDPNFEICRQTMITRGPCKINPCHRADRQQRVDNFWDIIPADHVIVKEENESRLQYCFSAVVQILATLWIQSSICKKKSA